MQSTHQQKALKNMFPVLEFAAQNNDRLNPRHAAAALFERARRSAMNKRFRATFNPTSRKLQHLCPSAVVSHHEVVQVVRLADITGSENRVDDFDIDFLPLEDHLEERWVRVAMAMQSDVALPLVELLELDGAYYVRDGHHRISVARALGFEVIEALVIRYRISAVG